MTFPARVAEPRSDLGSIRADRLDDLAPIRGDRVNGRGYAVDHDVDQKAWLGCGRAPEYPGAAHLAGRIVKGGTAIAALPDVPAEDPPVEIGRLRNVRGGNLDVADLAIRKRGRHPCSFRRGAILARPQLKQLPRSCGAEPAATWLHSGGCRPSLVPDAARAYTLVEPNVDARRIPGIGLVDGVE